MLLRFVFVLLLYSIMDDNRGGDGGLADGASDVPDDGSSILSGREVNSFSSVPFKV